MVPCRACMQQIGWTNKRWLSHSSASAGLQLWSCGALINVMGQGYFAYADMEMKSHRSKLQEFGCCDMRIHYTAPSLVSYLI
jgi:hypothetical protein